MAEPTLFEKIVDGSIPSFKVWEDDTHVAFLTPVPNTPGFTVVAPKKNPGDNYLDVDEAVFADVMVAAKKVAHKLQKAFGVQRVGLVIEGEGVPHLHVKLIPMHGQRDADNTGPSHMEFYPEYPGYLTTVEGPRMSNEELADIQQKIVEASE
jgi:histidine triad (HIT) family protein